MGATLVVRTHPDCSKEELNKWVANTSQQAAFEQGNSYSGDWNMCSGPVSYPAVPAFEDQAAAEEYISNNQSKWESLFAVKAKQSRSLSDELYRGDPTLQALRKQAQDLERQTWAFPGSVLKRVKDGKSRMKACEHCGSRISVAHLTTCHCPVCRADFLFTASDVKARQALDKKLAATLAKQEERRQALLKKMYKNQPTTETIWVVGGWCAC